LTKYANKLVFIMIQAVRGRNPRREYAKLVESARNPVERSLLSRYAEHLDEIIGELYYVFLKYTPHTGTFQCMACGRRGLTPRGAYLHLIRRHKHELEAVLSDIEDRIQSRWSEWISTHSIKIS